MAATPYFKCYPSDFLNGISDLTPQQIAVYLIVLLRLYDEEGAIPDNPQQIARRCNMRLPVCQKALDELCRQGKLTREDGFLYNKRARKEIAKRRERSTKQSKNVQERWKKYNENNASSIPPNYQDDTNAIPSRVQSPEAKAPPYPPKGGAASHVPLGDKLVEIAGMRTDYFGNYGVVKLWLDKGYSPDLIEEVVRSVAARDGYSPPGSLRYFDRAVIEHAERHGARDPRLEGDPETVRWRGRVSNWKNGSPNGKHPPGLWDAEGLGPPPDDPACQCPPAILAEFGIIHATGEAH